MHNCQISIHEKWCIRYLQNRPITLYAHWLHTYMYIPARYGHSSPWQLSITIKMITGTNYRGHKWMVLEFYVRWKTQEPLTRDKKNQLGIAIELCWSYPWSLDWHCKWQVIAFSCLHLHTLYNIVLAVISCTVCIGPWKHGNILKWVKLYIKFVPYSITQFIIYSPNFHGLFLNLRPVLMWPGSATWTDHKVDKQIIIFLFKKS